MALNPETLRQCLLQSMSPEALLRNAAEEAIKTLKHQPSSTPMLLSVTADQATPLPIRTAAVVQLKNICRECWHRQKDPNSPNNDSEDPSHSTLLYTKTDATATTPLLSIDDMTYVKAGILQALVVETYNPIRDLLCETINCIVPYDHPQFWPDLLPTLISNIQSGGVSGDFTRIHNSLIALRKLSKRYEFKPKDQRGPMNEIIEKCYPLLLSILNNLSSNNSTESGMMVKQVLKIFWSTTQFYMTTVMDANSLQPWYTTFNFLMGKKFRADEMPNTDDERNAWSWWKVKKWVGQIMSRLYNRYGNPKYAEEGCEEFTKHFASKVAPAFLGPVCETLALRSSGSFCSDRVVQLCLVYVDTAVEQASTYKMLKPHLDFLIYQVCFPVICLSPEDIELFNDDPHEFLGQQNSVMNDFVDPRLCAINLIQTLVKHRTAQVVPKLLSFLSNCLSTYANANETSKNHVEFDGALTVFGSLDDFLKKKKKYNAHIEPLLASSIAPTFKSNVGFLRSRAAWFAQRFADIEFKDANLLKALIESVLTCLRDPCLPVQIEASKALRFYIELESAETILLPVLPQILTEYFRIMNEIGNDEVVSALEIIIEKFGDHIEPHAVALVQNLSSTFLTYSSADEEDEDAAMAAAQCLECIATVLRGVCERPEIFRVCEPVLVPLIAKIMDLSGELIEYLENALDLIVFLTFYSTGISPILWTLFPAIFVPFDDYAYDYFPQMVTPLDNFISRDPRGFLSGVDTTNNNNIRFIDQLMGMASKVLTSTNSSELDCRKALSLFMSIVHNCTEPDMRSNVDTYLPAINEMALNKLKSEVKNERIDTRVQCWAVLGSLLYYDPEKEFAELERRGVPGELMILWISDCEHLEKWLPKKATVLGWLGILSLGTERLRIAGIDVGVLVRGIIEFSTSLKEEYNVDGENEEGEEEGDDDDIDDEDEDEDDEENFDDGDVEDDEDEAYAMALKQDGGMSKYFGGGDDWDDDDEELETPLDKVKDLQLLEQVFNNFMAREPLVFQEVQKGLSVETKVACAALYKAAKEEREAPQEETKGK